MAYPNGHTIRTTSVHPTFHDTPMVGDFKTALRKSGMSVFPAENVSRMVVDQVLKGCSGKLYVPDSFYIVSFIKMLPPWFGDAFFGHVKRSRRVGQATSKGGI